MNNKKEYMGKVFKKYFSNSNSIISINGIKWSTTYHDVDLDIIYGEPHREQVLIYRFTYKDNVSNVYMKESRFLEGINEVILDKLKDENGKLSGLYERIDECVNTQIPSRIKEPKLLKAKYLDVDRTYYVSNRDENYKLEKELNSEEFYEEHKNIVTNITSVSDYLRAITLILSNRYILKVKGVDDIRRYENIFSYPGDDTLSTVIKKDGLFFRGESQEYNYQVPGLYRKFAWIKNEEKILNYNQIFSPEDLTKENTIFDNLTVLQHHGGVTRILDVTSNALIALYFAVSNSKNEDGYVYLISGEKKEEVGGEIKYPNSISVLTKASLAELTFEQKKVLFEKTYEERNNGEDLKHYITSLQKEELSACLSVIDKLYSNVQKYLNTSFVSIKVKDLYGVDIVQPFRIDRRIIQQSSAFLIFGLENLSSVLSEHFSSSNKEVLLENIQQESSDLLYKMGINYSPENFIGLRSSMGIPRIQIKDQYKKRIIDELDILGINESTVYPDINHKTQRINNEFANL